MRVRRRVVTLVGIAVFAAFLWVLVTTTWLWRNQERVVFQPPDLVVSAPARARRVDFRAADGRPVYGYLLEPSRPRAHDDAVVIAFHGNADLAAWYVPWASEVAERARVRVLVPEYRGYGGIPGPPTYESAAADAVGALSYARTELHTNSIVLFGHSLGSAIAAEVAVSMRPDRPHALILQSPLTSARDMATRMLVPPIPWLWQRISRVHYDTRRIVAELDVPVWVAHGARDVVIPARMGRQVYAAARRPAELLLVEGAGHNDVADVAGEDYWRWLTSAIGTAADTTDQRRSENSKKKATGTFQDS